MKKLNNASLPLSFAEGKYSSESVNLPEGQYIVKIIATGPCIGKVLKDNEVLAEVDFSSYKTLYNNLSISFILQSESAVSLEVTPKRGDVKVYSASLSSSLLPVGKGSGGGGEWEEACKGILEGTLTVLDDSVVPSGTRHIKQHSFYQDANITSIDLTYVTSIGKNSFNKCTSLTYVNMPAVTEILDNAFYDCEHLTEVNIPSATSVGQYAFYNCYALASGDFSSLTQVGLSAFVLTAFTEVNLPLATYLDNFAFSNCSHITEVNLPLATHIGNKAFHKNISLVSAYLPLVEEIGVEAFSECSSLESIELPAVVRVGDNSSSSYDKGPFPSCTNLTTVDIGPNVTFIGYATFAACSNLKSVTVRATTPPELRSSAFNNTHADLVIYVPAESVDTYKAASGWSSYASKIQAIVE